MVEGGTENGKWKMVNEGGALWKYGVTSKAMEKQCQFFLSLGVPQGSAQLLPWEGAKRLGMCHCV